MTINPSIFKAYDIRGVYGRDFDEQSFYDIAQIYAKLFRPKGAVVVGRDVRLSSAKLQKAVMAGLTDAGIDVIDIGLASTELYYFAVGQLKASGGLQVTASHNPKEWNGLKMVKKDVEPIHQDNGIATIKELALKGWRPTKAKTRGEIKKQAVLGDFCRFASRFLEPAAKKPLKLVINPNFGYEGEVVKRFVRQNRLPWQLVGLNDTPDGNFPKGRPDPFVPENRPEFVALTKKSGADLGVAWDADADRVFFCDDQGNFIESYHINHLLIKSLLHGRPNEVIVYDPRYTWALIDAAKAMRAKPVLERVGHSYIKERMRKENAIFSGESSGHTYFRDFWYADTGLIPLIILANLVAQSGQKLSRLIAPIMKQYPISGEINSTVDNPDRVMAEIEKLYRGGKKTKIDGLAIEFPDWRFSLRKSNTEPLLRLNVEAKTKANVKQKTKELLALIRK